MDTSCQKATSSVTMALRLRRSTWTADRPATFAKDCKGPAKLVELCTTVLLFCET